MSDLNNITKPFFVLAPMDDVTDIVFRQVIDKLAPPDVYFTEFVNVDGLQSRGRKRIIHKLWLEKTKKPVIAQIWGKTPNNYEKVAAELVEMGFSGVDINMGCPDKSVVKNGCCSALINNRDLAAQIIRSVKKGVNGQIPVSVKIRTGFNEVDFSWPEFVLNRGIDLLTVHGRTTKELSKVPASWDDIKKVREIRDKIAPKTIIVGNGDVESRQHGELLAKQTGVDGIMIGRAIFTDPYIFSNNTPWSNLSEIDKLQIYKSHIELFASTYQNRERNWQSLKRMAKVYIHATQNASTFRDKLVRSETLEDMLEVLSSRINSLV